MNLNDGYPNPPAYYQYARKFRVDLEGNGDFDTIKEACDAAVLLTRDSSNFVLVEVNAGIYEESPFTIPSWVILKGEGASGEDGVPSTQILIDGPPATGGVHITIEDDAVVTQLTVLAINLPVNFTADFKILDVGKNVKLDRCRIDIEQYAGTNTLYGIFSDATPPDAHSWLYRCSIYMSGTSAIMLSTTHIWDLEYSNFDAFNVNRIAYFDHPTATPPSKFTFCNLYPYRDAALGSTFVELTASSELELISTRLPFIKRAGTGTYIESHPTPRQLDTAIRAGRIYSTAVDYTLRTFPTDGDAADVKDATVLVDASGAPRTITLPLLADVGIGEVFIIKKYDSSNNSVTVDGNGVETIDGALTQVFSRQYDTIAVQRGLTEWLVVFCCGPSFSQNGVSNIKTVSVNYTILTADGTILVDTSAGDITIDLPLLAAVTKGQQFKIKKITSDFNEVIIDGNGVDVDDDTTFNLVAFNESVTAQNDAVQWWLVG